MTEFVLSDKIQYYRNRRGEKVGPVNWSTTFLTYTCDGFHWNAFGRRSEVYELPDDLVAVWGEEPINLVRDFMIKDNVLEYTSVVKDGDYGIVQIEYLGDSYKVFVDEQYVSAEELRHAAKVFEELADFIEKQD